MISTKDKTQKFCLLLYFSTMIFKSTTCKFQDYESSLFSIEDHLNIEKKLLDEEIKKIMVKDTYDKNSKHIGVLVHVAVALIQIYHVTDSPSLLFSSTFELIHYVCNTKSPYKDCLSDILGICVYPFYAEDGSFDLFTGVPWDHPLRIIPSLKKVASNSRS